MKPLLILHGALGSASQMKPLEIILNRNYKVYTLDFSSHGLSNKQVDAFSIQLFVNDVRNFLTSKNMQTPIDIFGYSMGGYVALTLANQSPQHVNKIFTLATKFDWNKESSIKESAFLNTNTIENKVPHFAKMLADRHGENHWKTVCNKTAEMMIQLGENPVLNQSLLQTIHQPCIISIGEKDKMVTQEETLQVANSLPNARFKQYENLEHPFEKIDYELLSNDLVEFLGK
jgi:esterase/lipase